MTKESLDKFIEENGGYWEGECKEWPKQDWRYEVACGDTLLGYWEWAYQSTWGEE